jgi:hypothetical protein
MVPETSWLGIGVAFAPSNGSIVVTDVYEGGPVAMTKSIKEGDTITAINCKDIQYCTEDFVKGLLSGKNNNSSNKAPGDDKNYINETLLAVKGEVEHIPLKKNIWFNGNQTSNRLVKPPIGELVVYIEYI